MTFIDTTSLDEFQAIMGQVYEYVDTRTPAPYTAEEIENLRTPRPPGPCTLEMEL